MYTHCFSIILIERFRITFTSNGKLEFAPRDILSLYCCLLFIKFYTKFSTPFLYIRIVLNCLFSILRNSQLESDVCRIGRDSKSLYYLVPKKMRTQSNSLNQRQLMFLLFSKKIYMLFCSLADVGQIVSRNMMLNLSVLCVTTAPIEKRRP